jgi:DNA repair protein RecO (recombination protein O)
MKFSDEGIIISLKKYGENSLIVKVFSRHHGVYRGFVKSVKSTKDRAIFQIGNFISFEFRARIEENLGQFFSVDLVKSYCSKIIFDSLRIDCLNSLFSIVDESFLEHETQPILFEKLLLFLQEISFEENSAEKFLSSYIKLELKILKTLGYGIDLSSCVVTGSKVDLAFVSTKSARAVSFAAGSPYKNKLLKLPKFLLEESNEVNSSDLSDGLRLSGYFLEKFIFEDRQEKLAARKKLALKILEK